MVLDFWATWCGPCLQAMPQVDRVVREFSDQDVQLIAVNLEEPAKQITSTLERHKLQMAVALDRDGVVAAKYEATAIPQTVIIEASPRRTSRRRSPTRLVAQSAESKAPLHKTSGTK